MRAGLGSFSLKNANPKVALFVLVFAVVGFSAPIVYFAWWGLGGGAEREQQRRFARLARRDPVRDAEEAIARGDFKLYVIEYIGDAWAPGVGRITESYAQWYGYESLGTDSRDGLEASEVAVREAALKYIAEYNRRVHAGGRRRIRALRE